MAKKYIVTALIANEDWVGARSFVGTDVECSEWVHKMEEFYHVDAMVKELTKEGGPFYSPMRARVKDKKKKRVVQKQEEDIPKFLTDPEDDVQEMYGEDDNDGKEVDEV